MMKSKITPLNCWQCAIYISTVPSKQIGIRYLYNKVSVKDKLPKMKQNKLEKSPSYNANLLQKKTSVNETCRTRNLVHRQKNTAPFCSTHSNMLSRSHLHGPWPSAMNFHHPFFEKNKGGFAPPHSCSMGNGEIEKKCILSWTACDKGENRFLRRGNCMHKNP